MNLRAVAVNLAWVATSLGAWRKYRAALERPRETQTELLLRYLSANSGTEFGRAYGFERIRSVEEYQAKVPASTYDDLEPLVHRIARGARGVLTHAPVERLVPTGGSTAAAKLIPFTASLRREFSRAVDVWLVDLFANYPSLAGGPAYWSITPPAAFAVPIEASVPIGFDDDSMYLGGTRQRLARAIMAVPPELVRLRDPDAFLYATALFLVRARELRLISVWHPSLLERLLDVVDTHRERLVEDLGAGTLNPPTADDPFGLARLQHTLRPDPERAAELRRACSSDLRALWPRLALISCWADGLARGPAERLTRRAHPVAVQPKGLLATEGIVTIPLGDRHPLAVRSHFFEFVDDTGASRLADDLEQGREYTVLLTTGGGLYRYCLGDRVRVDGFVRDTPSLWFIGRDDRVSDWCGEKLTDGFVAAALQEVFAGRPFPHFALLAPDRTEDGLAYTLFVACEAVSPQLESKLETALRRNPQYAWCVDLGQLRPARIVPVGSHAPQVYIDICAARGQRIGAVKPAALHAHMGWREVFSSMDAAREEAVR